MLRSSAQLDKHTDWPHFTHNLPSYTHLSLFPPSLIPLSFPWKFPYQFAYFCLHHQLSSSPATLRAAKSRLLADY